MRLSFSDVVRLAAAGLRARPLRALLSALGIAIGVAAMLAVVGISSSGRADLQRVLDSLGTNLLSVEGGKTDEARLPAGATAMIRRIPPVLGAAAVSRLPDTVHVYRHERVPPEQTNGIIPYATDLDLPAIVGADVADGAWLNAATAGYPGVVLGHEAARRLGVPHARPDVLIQVGDLRFAVLGILAPVPLVPELDSAALMGNVAAQRYLHVEGGPTTIFLRAAEGQVTAVWSVLSATAHPEAPYLVTVSRPSDALAAKIATERAFNGLLLGLGAVALLVGGVGIANTMVISVLERRSEIGLRRALGARRGQIWLQFFSESLLLAALGGVAGDLLGSTVTAGYALTQDWPTVVPGWAVAAGIGATIAVGALAGLYPAIRAARLAPTEALAAA